MNLWLLLAVLSGPAIYWFVSLTKERRASSFETFHYAGRTVDSASYVDSTVMYAMQVAALTLFATWGFMYGIGSLWVPLFWGAGYWLLAKLLESGKLDDFLLQDHIGTIHQFLADKSQWRLIGVVAAIISLLGILGPAMYEARFVGTTVARINASSGGAVSETSLGEWLFVGFLLVAAVYMLYGGFDAIVSTDVWQLSIGFGGFSIFLAILLFRVAEHGEVISAALLSIVLLLCTGWLFFLWSKQKGRDISTLVTLSLSLCGYGVALIAMFVTTTAKDSWGEFWRSQQFGAPLGLGIMSLVSLLVANGLYQIVDIGQWQRLASVKMEESLDATRNTLARSVRYVMVYSPVTWVIAIVFGMALKYLMPKLSDPYDAVGAFLTNYWTVSPWLVILFIVAMVAIMLSTVDSLVGAIAFTLHNDCLVAFRPQWRTLKIGRVVTILFLIVGSWLYSGLSDRVSNFADILYTCWAFQIALFPLVMGAVLKNKLSPLGALAGLVAGICGSLLPLFTNQLNPYEHAPTLSLLASGLFMLAFNLLPKRPKEA